MASGVVPIAWLGILVAACCPAAVSAQTVERGPYLQQTTETGIVVRWRTDTATDTVVRYGDSPLSLDASWTSAQTVIDHVAELNGLTSGTRYYYSIGTASGALAGGDDAHFFVTAPPSGTAQSTRVWVLGDSGAGNDDARAVRDAYLDFTGTRGTDLVLMLGDNAYADGTDAEYETAVFDTYPSVLIQSPLWSALGNHDGHTADSDTQTGPYYDIFSFPTQGESGGIASGTEAYYSFDYANVHFVSLDSYDTDTTPGSPMFDWLAADLGATSQPWIVAFWHHPPYSKGTHDSDTSTTQTRMRVNALPILEAHGVDLVLTGHSHTYERTFLLDSHYGLSDSLGPAMIVDSGDGRPDGDGAYVKPHGSGVAHGGTVYIAAGNASSVDPAPLDHEAMFLSTSQLGSIVLDVDGDRMDVSVVRDDGALLDYFSITKYADTTAPQLIWAKGDDVDTVRLGFSERLDPATAMTVANYAIQGLTLIEATHVGNGSEVVIRADSALVDGAIYALSVDNVTDLAGNSIEASSELDFVFEILYRAEFRNGVSPDSAYNGAADTFVSEFEPANNFALAEDLVVDGDDPPGTDSDQAALLAWDLVGVPATSEVRGAVVNLQIIGTSTNAYDIHAVLRMWNASAATWTEASDGIAWELPGAKGISDRSADSLGTLQSSQTGQVSVALNTAGTAVVQGWIDGSEPNQGIIIADETNTDGLDFLSSETPDLAFRPELVITFTNPPDGDGDGIPDAQDNCSALANPDQRDTNGDGFGNLCDTDIDNDGTIGFSDLAAIKAVFLTNDADADFDGDGVVSFSDLARMKATFLGQPGPSGVAPPN